MKSKTVLITGASRGIGKAIATAFAENGCNVVITCKNNKEQLEQLKEELEARFHISCLAFVGDMGSLQTVTELFRQIEARFSGIDMLINNAGISKIGLLSDMMESEWDEIVTSNLKSVFCCSKSAIPYMVRRQAGKIINISSVWGITGASCEAAYSATKGGINALTRALAKELAPSHIQVNAIACGAIDTEMNQFLDAEERRQLMEEIPAGRFGAPEEVAALALQLCTGNSYLTGQIIALDGGWI